jgi:hypothetical protein
MKIMRKATLIAAAFVSISTVTGGALPTHASVNSPIYTGSVPVINYRGDDSYERRVTNFYRRHNLIEDKKRQLRQRNYRYCYTRHGRKYCQKGGYGTPQ